MKTASKLHAELTESELYKASQIFAQAINDLNESGLMEESRLNYQVNKFLESIIEEKTREGAIKVAMKNYTPSKALGDMQPIVEAIDALIDAGYISLPTMNTYLVQEVISNTGDWIESKIPLEDVAKHIEAYIKQNQFPQWSYVQILQILNQLLNEKR